MSERTPTQADIDVYGLTHPGKVRKNNQDHFLIAVTEMNTKDEIDAFVDVLAEVGRD